MREQKLHKTPLGLHALQPSATKPLQSNSMEFRNHMQRWSLLGRLHSVGAGCLCICCQSASVKILWPQLNPREKSARELKRSCITVEDLPRCTASCKTFFRL
jgi:hypothetical protein